MRSDARSGRLWAVTAYFNPVPYRRRLANYRIFRERLPLPLATVELAYGPAPELGEGDADILVQLRGRDVMWQKERLLNLAIARLPADCDRVVWLDCDIVLADELWPERIDRMLDAFALVQGFGRVQHLGRDWQPGTPSSQSVAAGRASVAKAIADGLSPAVCFDPPAVGRNLSLATGLAWAARRDLLERRGLYDAAIIGSGDRLMAAAAYGRFEGPAGKYGMQGPRLQHFAEWARAWEKAVAGSIGVLDGDIFALWHGEAADRRYSERQIRLSALGYDPFADIALDEQGVWRWNSDKPAMHRYVQDYFAARLEDG